MSMLQRIFVKPLERALVYRDGRAVELLRPGRYLRFAPLGGLTVTKLSVTEPWINLKDLRFVAKSGVLAGEAIVLDLADHERAIVRIDGRYNAVLGKGVSALWTAERKVEVERYEVRGDARLDHPALPLIVELPGARELVDVAVIAAGFVGLVFRDGRPAGTLQPGLAAFWKGAGKIVVQAVDGREQVLDVAGQEILTADQVTLRLNALAVYKVADAWRAVTAVDAYAQALYREVQLALRAVVGTRTLEAFLAGKDAVLAELASALAPRVAELGLSIVSLGVRDVILPGEMKALLNRVVEARAAAEAALLTRREETAAMRMQANTARIFESSPALMKLRELEVLEKVADKANLTVVLGEGSLTERVVKMV
jgi:regulator of protease activity HflC (stomatin/prohibitin superfamily)